MGPKVLLCYHFQCCWEWELEKSWIGKWFIVFFHVHTWIEIIWAATKVKSFSESSHISKTHQNDAWQADLSSRSKWELEVGCRPDECIFIDWLSPAKNKLSRSKQTQKFWLYQYFTKKKFLFFMVVKESLNSHITLSLFCIWRNSPNTLFFKRN